MQKRSTPPWLSWFGQFMAVVGILSLIAATIVGIMTWLRSDALSPKVTNSNQTANQPSAPAPANNSPKQAGSQTDGSTDRRFLPIKLELLDQYVLPKQDFNGVKVGGWSGLSYDPRQDLFYVISDDRSDLAPARFYTFKANLVPGNQPNQVQLKQIQINSAVTLHQADGSTYPPKTIDPEAIALSPKGTVYVSTEGIAPDLIPPLINEYERVSGNLYSALPIPKRYAPALASSTKDDTTPSNNPSNNLPNVGVRDNLGFEAMTVVGDAPSDPYRIFAITENALAQDHQELSLVSKVKKIAKQEPSPSRFLHYVENNVVRVPPMLVAEHLYLVEAPPVGGVNGVVEMAALDRAGHFLTLERSFSPLGFGAKIWQINTTAATDTSRITSFRGNISNIRPIAKQLVLDLGTLGISLDNIEGMAFGPKLADGSQSLLLVSDDNFSDRQMTQVLLLRLKTDIT
ncbi:MAG: esterase-like activity of phytase family protein [Pseudanabaenaceae cyanobacterium]|jgi:hypothetical protein